MISHNNYGDIVQYSEFKVTDWFQNSSNIHPILLLMGEDPIQLLMDYVNKKKYRNVVLVAMGQGQNRVAEAVLDK
jgi:hypothetical protein